MFFRTITFFENPPKSLFILPQMVIMSGYHMLDKETISRQKITEAPRDSAEDNFIECLYRADDVVEENENENLQKCFKRIMKMSS